MNTSGSPAPVSSACSVTPSSITIAGMTPPSALSTGLLCHFFHRIGAHNVLVCLRRRACGVPVGQGREDIVMLAGGAGGGGGHHGGPPEGPPPPAPHPPQ